MIFISKRVYPKVKELVETGGFCQRWINIQDKVNPNHFIAIVTLIANLDDIIYDMTDKDVYVTWQKVDNNIGGTIVVWFVYPSLCDLVVVAELKRVGIIAVPQSAGNHLPFSSSAENDAK